MSDQNTSLPVRTEANGDVVAKISDGTTNTQLLAVDSSGKISDKLNDGAGNAITSQTNGAQRALDVGIDVAGVQIDPRQVRALTSADVVTANQGSANTAANGWPVKPTDGTNSQVYLAGGEAKVSVTQPLPAGTNSIGKVDIQNASGEFTNVNPLPVSVVSAIAGAYVNKYNTTASVAANASSNHDYAITATKTLSLKKVWASSSGKLKAEVQTSPDGTTFTSYWVGFNSTANPSIDIDLGEVTIQTTGTGSKVRVILTNRDNQAEDVYSTISGVEN